jgi:hypothetical protein
MTNEKVPCISLFNVKVDDMKGALGWQMGSSHAKCPIACIHVYKMF